MSRSAAALLGVGVAVALRAVADTFVPGVAPYSFVYPAVLFSTLLGGWMAGLGTMAIGGYLAWMFVVPRAAAVGAPMNYQGAALVITAITAFCVIAVAEGFRAAARHAARERNAKLAERELLFRELQHRVANDFTLATSLLELQRRKSASTETRSALDQAIARLRSIGRVHRQIYILPETRQIELCPYLNDLCAGLSESTLPPLGISLACACDPAWTERDRALSIGLLTNELITNAVKHAFPGGREGRIAVGFHRTDGGWRLSVEDDGVGFAPEAAHAGLGTGLIQQFARQAGAKLTTENKGGVRVFLDFPAEAASATQKA